MENTVFPPSAGSGLPQHTKARRAVSVCSRLGLAALSMFVVWQVAGSVAIFLVQRHMPWVITDTSWGLLLLNDAALYLLGLPAFLLVWRTIPAGPAQPARRPAFKLNIGRVLLLLVMCLGTMYIFNIVTLLFTSFIEVFRQGSNPGNDMLSKTTLLTRFIFVAIVPGLGEEFIFRYLLRRKLEGAGDKIYIFLSGLLFGIFHGNFSQIFYAMAVGMVFAWIYLRTGKIWVTMLLHFLVNLVGAVLLVEIVEYDVALMVVGLLMLGCIGGAIAMFCINIKKEWRAMQPPTEPGWPYKAPKPEVRFAPYPPYYPGAYYGAPYYAPYYPPAVPYPYNPYAQPHGGYPVWYGAPAYPAPYTAPAPYPMVYSVPNPAPYVGNMAYAAPPVAVQYATTRGTVPPQYAVPPQQAGGGYGASYPVGGAMAAQMAPPPQTTGQDGVYRPPVLCVATGRPPQSHTRPPYNPLAATQARQGALQHTAVPLKAPPVPPPVAPQRQSAAPWHPVPAQDLKNQVVLNKRGKPVGAARVCLLNVGMILYLAVGAFVTLANLFA